MKSLEKCDFKPMFEHFEREKEKKKAMTKDEKKAYVCFTSPADGQYQGSQG